jgi:beta-phosphoglucomutase
MFKAAIFDLDGVIVDTAKFHYLAWKRLSYEKFGFEFTEDMNESFKGVNRIRCMEMLNVMAGGGLSKSEIQQYADIKNEWYKEYISKMDSCDILPGALEFINSCKDMGLSVSIASASKNTPMVLSRISIDGFFDAVVDGNSVTKAKPAPEIFLTAARMCGMVPQECTVFEDSQAGIDGAKSAGMKCIAIGSNKTLKNADIYVPGLYAAQIEDIKRLFSA